MTKPAAIMGSLVDARNVGQHKSVKLTVHVPAELAMRVFDAFGWPTMAEPVAVAIARLNPERTVVQRTGQLSENKIEPASVAPEQPERAPRPFTSLPLPQQAALLCQDPVFWSFLNEVHEADCIDAESAAHRLRVLCDVDSRRELRPDNQAGKTFIAQREQFLAWKLVAA